MAPTVEPYNAVIGVTLAYVLLYYVFMVNILRVKRAVVRRCRAEGTRFDRYGGHYPDLLAADRVQLNTLEHMPPFLVLLWLHAWVVSPNSAAVLGGLYVLLRATYPLFLGERLGRNIPMRLLVNTCAGYAVLACMGGWVALALMGHGAG